MSDIDPKHMDITPVPGKPRWRLAYCYNCSDGYRGLKATAEKWAREHLAEQHGDAK